MEGLKRRLEIKKAGINGEGIAYYRKKPVFIEGCFPDETVECVLSDNGTYWRGRLLKTIKKSPDRIIPACSRQKECGGCALMSLDYEKQLEIKKQLLEEALNKYASIDYDLPGIVPSPDILGYRNRCNMPVVSFKGKLVNAMYRQGTNSPAVIEDCPVQDKEVERIRKNVLDILNKHKCEAYSSKTKKGIRQLVIRGFDDEYQAVLVTGDDRLDKDMTDEIGNILKVVCLYQCINTRKETRDILDGKMKPLHGKEKILLDLDRFRMHLSPEAFFQLNRKQAERIYSDVNSLIPSGCGKIVEAYCGTGAISFYLADKAGEIIGIDIDKKAIGDAKENASLNGFTNTRFVCGDAGRTLKEILKKDKVDALVIDPPRSGIDDELLQILKDSNIENIVYVSCNPATLAKNLKVLKEGYEVKYIQGYDMFPNTPLVETVCHLKRNRTKHRKQ
ncbi:MAG: 23S rRNA (uracil(1939)-C(5))-methyltransferase RlmD [Erysipelotrichaceae bacterium]|nr:23S rRNA (uracil(1939)-C(5))-methyltransferase RlmD [Erysipelotrichaceae bacterium]